MKATLFRTKIVGAFAAGLIVIVAACGGGTSGNQEPTPALGATATPVSTPTATSSANRPPTADFTFQPDAVARGDNNVTLVTFTATASDPNGDLLTFEWRFSSGIPQTGAGQVATTTFAGLHPYPVTLTVSDGRGGTVTVQKTVPVIR